MSSPARPAMWLSRPLPMGVDHLSIKQGCSPGCFLGLFLPKPPPSPPWWEPDASVFFSAEGFGMLS